MRAVLRGHNHQMVQDALTLVLQDSYPNYKVTNNPVVEDYFNRTEVARPRTPQPSAEEADEEADNTNFKRYKKGITNDDPRFRADILLTPGLTDANN